MSRPRNSVTIFNPQRPLIGGNGGASLLKGVPGATHTPAIGGCRVVLRWPVEPRPHALGADVPGNGDGGGDSDTDNVLHRSQVFRPRRQLLLSTWLSRKLPPRDWLFAGVLCTTSRWLIFGDTGVGKTLIALDIAGAAAAGQGFLGWTGSGKRVRVMYFDGEMPAETAKERLEIIAERYGSDLELWFYNRDVIDEDAMPPLNTEDGEKWLMGEVEAVKPDLIVFDNIMSLLIGSMNDPESWAPIILLIRRLSSKRIAQVWIHHTGHDTSRGYGDKTREWQMDTVVRLTGNGDDEPVTLDFTKSRLKTPQTKDLYRPRKIACGPNGCEVIGDAPKPGRTREMSGVAMLKIAILDAYDRLADAVAPLAGFAGETVRKVETEAIREDVRDRGFLDVDERGRIEGKDRMAFKRAKGDLITKRTLIEAKGHIWRLYGKQK
jgi:hypothetical protein